MAGPKDDPDPKLAVVPTAQDQMAGDFAAVTRLWQEMIANADSIGKVRKALYDSYLKAGFTEAQALDLCGRSLVL